MWIISRCVPAVPGLTLGSNSVSELLELSVGSNGKPLRASSWLRAWKKNAWLKRLFGRIYEPSTAQRGVDAWIHLLRDTRVNRSPMLASDVARTILDTCGLKCDELFPSADRVYCFSKTSVPILATEQIPCSGNFKTWATKLRRVCLLRRKLARRIVENDCLSWATPNTLKGGATSRSGDRKEELLLGGQCRQWPTPTVPNGGRGELKTPTDRKVQIELSHVTGKWPTPQSRDGKGTPGENFNLASLPRDSERWGTPTTRDHKDGACLEANVPVNGLLGGQAVSFPPDQTETGTLCRNTSGRRLNPMFVGWLMGWPPIVPTGSDSLATEWCHWKRRMRSALSGLH